jgi:hypothetical protein
LALNLVINSSERFYSLWPYGGHNASDGTNWEPTVARSFSLPLLIRLSPLQIDVT